MKTNVVMTRKMGSFEVNQRTSDSMFNATQLLKQWNKSFPSQKKEIGDFFRTKSTQEYINTILEDESFTDGNSPYVKLDAKDGNSHDLHTRNSVYVKSRASRGKNAGTWMHPYLFIDFAMWLNPKFKLKVIKFVHDQLIVHRHSAGDNYNVLSAAVSRLKGKDYREVAIGMQWLIFNKRGKNLRQTATPDQLKELSETEHFLARNIDMGLITSMQQLRETLRKMYQNKYPMQIQMVVSR